MSKTFELEQDGPPQQTSESEISPPLLPPDWLSQLRSTYPKRNGGGAAPRAVERLVNAAIANGAKWERILLGAKNYSSHCGKGGKVGTEYVMMLQTFVGRDWHFEEWADMDLRSPAQKAEDTEWDRLQIRVEALGFTVMDRSVGMHEVRRVIEAAERKAAREVMDKAGFKIRSVG